MRMDGCPRRPRTRRICAPKAAAFAVIEDVMAVVEAISGRRRGGVANVRPRRRRWKLSSQDFQRLGEGDGRYRRRLALFVRVHAF